MKKIAIIPGRFQPVTNGHIKQFDRAAGENDEVYVVVIGGGTGKAAMDIKKNPIPIKERVKMVNKVTNHQVISFTSANFPHIFLTIIGEKIEDDWKEVVIRKSKNYEITVYAGSDRAKDYLKWNENYFNDFDTKEIQRDPDDVSATQVRTAIIAGDEKLFKELTPKQIHNEFSNLQRYIKESRDFLDDIIWNLGAPM